MNNLSTTVDSIEVAMDDFHIHLRDLDDGRLQLVAPYTAQHCNRALVMPNLNPPIRTVKDALAYRERILRITGDEFEPLMTLYLTGQTRPDDIYEIAQSGGRVVAVKYYPAGATTNSEFGVGNIRNPKVLETIACIQEIDAVFCLHGETADLDVDVFDREEEFMPDFFFLRSEFPTIRMVLEHITTIQAVQAVRRMQGRRGRGQVRLYTAATITPQHILINRNHMLGDKGVMNDFCKPILKREKHRQAVLEAATSGEPCFFLGTDSAPHAKGTKENACGCAAGCFTAPHALPLYAEAFDSIGKIGMLPDFAGKFGAGFYGLPAPTKRVRLIREEWKVQQEITRLESRSLADRMLNLTLPTVVPFFAGETLHWKLAD